MRVIQVSAVVLALALIMPVIAGPQQESDRKVSGGGISAPGWQGKVDARAASGGASINDSKFVQEGNAFHLTIGPAAVYWNPANMAKGDYTVKATFREPRQTFSHPHPYGLFIGGSKLNTDQPDLMYCVAYRDGSYLVRMFADGEVKTLSRGENPAVKSAGPDQEVVQDIAWNVKDGRAECVINGKTVASFNKAEIVGPGKLESTDGIAGIRVTHNTDVVVTNFAVTK